jgi:hypothetical protein
MKQMGLHRVAEDGDLVLGRDVVEKEVREEEGRRGDCPVEPFQEGRREGWKLDHHPSREFIEQDE